MEDKERREEMSNVEKSENRSRDVGLGSDTLSVGADLGLLKKGRSNSLREWNGECAIKILFFLFIGNDT